MDHTKKLQLPEFIFEILKMVAIDDYSELDQIKPENIKVFQYFLLNVFLLILQKELASKYGTDWTNVPFINRISKDAYYKNFEEFKKIVYPNIVENYSAFFDDLAIISSKINISYISLSEIFSYVFASSDLSFQTEKFAKMLFNIYKIDKGQTIDSALKENHIKPMFT